MVGQPQLAVGKRTLVEQLGHEEPLQSEAPREAPSSGPLSAIRFNADADLLAVATGKNTLVSGASGIAVTKVQRALIELGHTVTVTGTVDPGTIAALKAFQHAKGISETGSIDKATMLALDAAFTDYSAEGKVLRGMKPSTKPTEGKPYDVGKAPKELLSGTHVPDATERAALQDALSTETKADPKTGVPPTFVEVVRGQKYGDRIEAAVNKVIDGQLAWAKPMEKDRKAGHLYDWGDIEKVGVQSKAATDASFGSYATGKPLKATGVDAKIKDAWEFKEKELAADPGAAGDAATWRVTKILDGHASISAIDAEHGAIQTRAAEKAIVDALRTKIATARKTDLVLIHKAWPAFASGNDVFIQRIENMTPRAASTRPKAARTCGRRSRRSSTSTFTPSSTRHTRPTAPRCPHRKAGSRSARVPRTTSRRSPTTTPIGPPRPCGRTSRDRSTNLRSFTPYPRSRPTANRPMPSARPGSSDCRTCAGLSSSARSS